MKIQRLAIGSLGGYIIASLLTITLTFILDMDKLEAVLLSTLVSYIIWMLLILYSFTVVKIKNLLIQFSLISINLYLINTYLFSVKL